jgi:hypothetical protein
MIEHISEIIAPFTVYFHHRAVKEHPRLGRQLPVPPP